MLDLLSGFFLFFSPLCPHALSSHSLPPCHHEWTVLALCGPFGCCQRANTPLRCATPALVVCFLYFWANAYQGDRLSVRP